RAVVLVSNFRAPQPVTVSFSTVCSGCDGDRGDITATPHQVCLTHADIAGRITEDTVMRDTLSRKILHAPGNLLLTVFSRHPAQVRMRARMGTDFITRCI